jgi:hypothetical protein
MHKSVHLGVNVRIHVRFQETFKIFAFKEVVIPLRPILSFRYAKNRRNVKPLLSKNEFLHKNYSKLSFPENIYFLPRRVQTVQFSDPTYQYIHSLDVFLLSW